MSLQRTLNFGHGADETPLLGTRLVFDSNSD